MQLANLLIGILFLLGNVTIAWDPSETPEVTGYKVYYGRTAGVYGQPVNAGNVLQYTVSGLAEGDWYFTCTAYDEVGNESDFATARDDPTKQYVTAYVPSPCDRNGDKRVSSADIQIVTNAIISGSLAGDVNDDGRSSSQDLQYVLNYVLTGKCQ